MQLWLQFALLALFPLGHLGLILFLLRCQRSNQKEVLVPMTLALLLGGIWASGLLAGFTGRSIDPTWVNLWQQVARYTLPLIMTALLFASHRFLRSRQQLYPRWLYMSLAGLAITLLLDPAIVPLHLPDLHLAGRVIPHAGLWQITWILWWLLPALAGLVSIIRFYPHKAGPLHRNRVRYWGLAYVINLIGDLLIFSQQPIMTQAAAPIKLLAGSLATIDLLIYRLPDMRVILHRAISTLLEGIALLATVLIAILAAQSVIHQIHEPEAAFWATAGIAAIAVAIQFPLGHLVRSVVKKILSHDVFDLDIVLRDYCRSINETLELEQLAQRMITAADRALHIDQGTLIMVNRLPSGWLVLAPVSTCGRPALPQLRCLPHTALAAGLINTGEPLAQYDIDVLPDFETISDDERAVLQQWKAELFVPISSRGQVAGILALGTKRSGTRYLDPDITLLTTLADQTAVALENARLFNDLKSLNQQMIELNQELERANLELLELDKLKSNFLGMITHELRSPLVPLDLSLQVINRHGLDNMLPEQRQQFEQLEVNLARLRSMIDNLVSFASLVSKQRALQLTKVDIGAVTRDVVTTLELMSRARRVSVNVVEVEGMPLVTADRERLADAIHHLVHNGIKFNRPGGEVNVRCSYQGDQAQIQVSDTGRGIPVEKLDQLGIAFNQLIDPIKRGVEGMGLGLALVQYIVQAHGGKLLIDSQLGVGSTFSIRIPLGGPTIRPAESQAD